MADYRYNCSNGHYIESNKPVTACPVYSKGSPCAGSLSSKGKRETSAIEDMLTEVLT